MAKTIKPPPKKKFNFEIYELEIQDDEGVVYKFEKLIVTIQYVLIS